MSIFEKCPAMPPPTGIWGLCPWPMGICALWSVALLGTVLAAPVVVEALAGRRPAPQLGALWGREARERAACGAGEVTPAASNCAATPAAAARLLCSM